MADETKKVLLEVSLEVKEAIKNLTATRSQIQELRKAQKELDVTTDEGKQMYEAYGAQIRELSNAARQQQKEIDNTIKAQKAEAGSMEQLKANLSNLTAEYNKLSKEQRNTAEGIELRDQIKGISDELKEAEEPLGDFRRSVGEYEDKIRSALGLNKGFTGTLTEMSQGSDGAAGGFKAMTAGAKAFGKQLLTLLANPVVLIIAGIAAVFMVLVGVFKKVVDTIRSNEEQSNRLTAALAPLKVIGDAVTRVFEKLGERLISLAEGFGKVVGWMADFLGISKEINQETKDYIQLEKEKANLIKDTRILNVEASKTELEISELRNKIAQKDKYTAQERAKFVDQAIAKEMKLAEERRKLAERNLAILEEEGARTKNNAEFEDKLAAARIAVNNATRDALNKTKELASQRVEALNALKAEGKAEEDRRKSLAERIYKAEIDLENLRSQTIINLQKEIADNQKKSFTERIYALSLFESEQISIIERNRDTELKKEGLTAKERKLIRAKADAEIKNLKAETEKSITSIETQELEKRFKKSADALEKKKQQISDQQSAELEKLSADYANAVKSAKTASDLVALQKQYEKDKFDTAQKYREADFNESINALTTQLNLENLSAEQRIELEKTIADAKSKYAQESAQIAIKANEDVVKNHEEAVNKQIELEQQLKEKKQELFSQLQTTLQDITNGVFERKSLELDEETSRITQNYDKQIASAEGNDAKQKKLEAEKQKRIDAQEAKKRKLVREQAISERLFAAFSIGLSTTKAVMAALAPPPVGLGPVAGIPLGIVTAGIGALQLASVMAAPLPKAKRGKVFKGPSHENGGIPVEVEGDEIILTKGVYRDPLLRNIASMINQAGGGIPLTSPVTSNMYATGGVTSFKFQDGGYVSRHINDNGLTKEDIEEAMERAIAKFKIYATIEDIRREDKKYTEIEQSATF